MRQDMKDVIVNTGRRGGGPDKGSVKQLLKDKREEFENSPQRLSMSPSRRSYSKSQNDRLNPLRRFLAKNINRKWDDVYSEIVGVTDRRSKRGSHLLENIKWMVQLTKHPRYGIYRNFYVDSQGFLRKSEPRRFPPRQYAVGKIIVSDILYYEIINGLWFRFDRYKLVRYRTFLTPRIDPVNSQPIQGEHVVEFHWDKNQCGQKDLRWIRSVLEKYPVGPVPNWYGPLFGLLDFRNIKKV